MIDGLLSRITGRRHHFKLMIHYVPDRSRPSMYAAKITTVWMSERRHINDERQIRLMVGPGMVEAIPKHHRRNGAIAIWATHYLGWFKPAT